MLNIGDSVKVIKVISNNENVTKTLTPYIGKVGIIKEIQELESEEAVAYGVYFNNNNFNLYYYFLEEELEKGHYVWVTE